jgi:hypothetical protein
MLYIISRSNNPLLLRFGSGISLLPNDMKLFIKLPYVALDIGQLENGRWIIIETGDPQFSGVSEFPLLQLWSRIREIDQEQTETV